ncbi:DUF951 domain-containing protein [Enterococcus plantarum]|nr:DUF951 domain-containing protein [Enterococcus plantarum]
MKRPHACQKNCWKIVRVGADIKIKCINCNHIVMMSRKKFIENLEYVVE